MILFIDACARKDSRTRKVAEYLLGKMNGEIQTLKLYEENLPILDETYLSKRTDACNNNNYFLECFKYAKQFAMADDIVIAAPYWDLSFPAVLKTYIENICVTGITFKYSEEGFPVGLCADHDAVCRCAAQAGGASVGPVHQPADGCAHGADAGGALCGRNLRRG